MRKNIMIAFFMLITLLFGCVGNKDDENKDKVKPAIIVSSGNLCSNVGFSDVEMEVYSDGTGIKNDKVDIKISFLYSDKDSEWHWEATGNNIEGSGHLIVNNEGRIELSRLRKKIINKENGVELIEVPMSGRVMFREKANLANSKESKYIIDSISTAIEVVDKNGKKYWLYTTYRKIADRTWLVKISERSGIVVKNNTGILSFDKTGSCEKFTILAESDFENVTQVGDNADKNGNPIKPINTIERMYCGEIVNNEHSGIICLVTNNYYEPEIMINMDYRNVTQTKAAYSIKNEFSKRIKE